MLSSFSTIFSWLSSQARQHSHGNMWPMLYSPDLMTGLQGPLDLAMPRESHECPMINVSWNSWMPYNKGLVKLMTVLLQRSRETHDCPMIKVSWDSWMSHDKGLIEAICQNTTMSKLTAERLAPLGIMRVPLKPLQTFVPWCSLDSRAVITNKQHLLTGLYKVTLRSKNNKQILNYTN